MNKVLKKINESDLKVKERLKEIIQEEIVDAKKVKYEPSQKLLRLLK